MKIMSYISENKAGAGIVALAIVALVVISVTQGCSFGSYIKTNVPADVQEVTGSQPKVTLNEAPYVREDFINSVTTSLAQFDEEIARADALRNLFADLLNTGLQLGGDAAAGSGVPLGGLLALVLGGVGGLFMEKPGAKKKAQAAMFNAARREDRETRRSYNKGQEHMVENLVRLGMDTLSRPSGGE